MKKITGLLFMFILVFSGCSSGTSDENVFIYPTKEVESMSILSSSYGDTFQFLTDIFTGLNQINADGKTVPGVAESVDKSADGLEYTFHLRDDAKWYDENGEEMAQVTAHDFEFAWKTMVDPASKSSYAYIFDVIKNAQAITAGDKDVDELGVTATDDTTLKVTLEYPAPYFESLVSFGAFYPIPEKAYKEFGDDWGQSASTTWYNGAFYPTEYDKSTVIKLAKAPLYFDADAVELNGVEYRKMEDTDLAYNSYNAGEISYAKIPTKEEYDTAKDDGTAHDKLTGYVYYLSLNQKDGITTDKTLREALAYGLNRDEISASYVGQEPIDYFVPKDLTPVAYDGKEYRDYAKDEYIPYDVDKAKQALDEYMKANNISDPADIELTLLANDTPAAKAVSTTIQSTFKQNLGITINVDTQPTTSYREKRNNLDYDLLLGAWGADYADPISYLGIFDSANIGSYNPGGYDNPEFDKKLNEVAKVQDVDKRFEMLADMENQILAEDYAIIPIYQLSEPYLIDDHFTVGYSLFNNISNQFTKIN